MTGTNRGGTAADYSGRSLKYVEQRRGQRGRPVSAARIARMTSVRDEMKRQTIPISARHLYYLLVSRGAIEKTGEAYERVLDDLLALRRSEDVPWEAVVDGTRVKSAWKGFYGSPSEAVDDLRATYRRDPWRTNGSRCEVWSESRGLLDTINEVASSYGVPTLGVGGFNSASVGWRTAQDVRVAARRDQRFVVFHLGDLDGSGECIGTSAERHIRDHLTDGEQPFLDFRWVALTREQVVQYNLPTAPPKKEMKDGVETGRLAGRHAKEWVGGNCELDALDPVVLKGMVRASILSVLDPKVRTEARVAEESDLAVLDRVLAMLEGSS